MTKFQRIDWAKLCATGLVVIQAPHIGLAQDAVIGRTSIAPFFEAAKSTRVDVVMLGDSNQSHQKDGWDHGWHVAMNQRYGLFATGMMPTGENDGFTMGLGYGYFSFFTQSSGEFLYAAAPALLDSLMKPGIGFNPQTYVYVPEADAVPFNVNNGLVLEPNQPIDTSANLRFHLMYGTFASADPGSFRLAVRNQSGPFTQLATGPIIQTSTGTEQSAVATLDLPAAPRDFQLNFRFNPTAGPELQGIDGPFIAYFTRAEMTDQAQGVAISSLYALGNQSTRDAADALNKAPDAQLTLYFSSIRALQGPTKHVLIRSGFGVNDRVEPLVSVGPKGIVPGWLPEAFADNLQAIINRVSGIWALNGWPLEELHFLFTITPPIDEPDDLQLMGFRDAAEQVALANPRTAVVRFERLTTETECVANGWYYKPWDRNHLSIKGYEVLAGREIDALASCVADVDISGTIDINDFIEFQTQFAIQSPAMDFDDSGTLDINDFIAFQTYYALGC
jgi:hypothetical protein